MKNLLKILIATLMVMTLTSAKAEFKFGVGVMGGLLSTDGTEVDPIADTSQQTKSLKEKFVGGDVFVENIFGNLWSIFCSIWNIFCLRTLHVPFVPFVPFFT